MYTYVLQCLNEIEIKILFFNVTDDPSLVCCKNLNSYMIYSSRQARNLPDLIDRDSNPVQLLRISVPDVRLRLQTRRQDPDRRFVRRHVHRNGPRR
jgi:hypothetical protein